MMRPLRDTAPGSLEGIEKGWEEVHLEGRGVERGGERGERRRGGREGKGREGRGGEGRERLEEDRNVEN